MFFHSFFPNKMQKSENDPAAMVTPIFLVFWAFTFIFFYCELGKAVTDEFDNIDEDLCQYKWYLLSVDTQRMMIIFMNDTQQPALLRGFGNVTCTRDSFKNVIISKVQYFWKIKIVHSLFLQLDREWCVLVFHDDQKSKWIENVLWFTELSTLSGTTKTFQCLQWSNRKFLSLVKW